MVARSLLAAAMTGAAFAPAVAHASWLVCLLALPQASSLSSIRKHTALFRQNGVAYHTSAELWGVKVAYKQNKDEVWAPYAYAKAVQQRGNSPIKIYHYTTWSTAYRIFKTRCLKASTKDENPSDARHGDGQYFTSMPPWANDDRLMHNNYDGAARKKGGKKLEAYVEIDVRSFLEAHGNDALKQVSPVEVDGRDIWVMPGEYDLPLDSVRHKIVAYHKEFTVT